MKNIIIPTRSPLRKLFPLVRKLRGWAWKFHDRIGIRLVISGGKIQFMDAALEFPETVALAYSTLLFWNGPEAYESPTSRTIALLAGRSKLFLDVGSNIGIYAVYVGVKFPQVQTIAFEPVPVICGKNRAFHRANGLSEAVTQNLALSDRDTVQTLYRPIFNTSLDEEETATLNPKSWQAHEQNVEKTDIQCLTLDTFAARTVLAAGPCCVKIDVEGFEAAVFRGAKKFLAARRPWIVCELLPCEEFDPATRTKRNNNQEVIELMVAANYAAFAITPDGLFRMGAADFARPRSAKDFLLIPAEKVPSDSSYLALENAGEIFAA